MLKNTLPDQPPALAPLSLLALGKLEEPADNNGGMRQMLCHLGSQICGASDHVQYKVRII